MAAKRRAAWPWTSASEARAIRRRPGYAEGVNGSSFAPTFWAIFFGSFIGFVFFAICWASRTRDEIARGVGLIDLARAVGGSVVSVASYPNPFVVFRTAGAPGCLYQWILRGREVITTVESRVGFPALLEASTPGSRRLPSRQLQLRVLRSAEDADIVTTDLTWANQTMEAGLREILRTLGSLTPRARITLATDRFTIEVEDRVLPCEMPALVALLDRLALLRHTTPSVGVTIVGEVDVADHGRCPVCSQTFVTPQVCCRQCKAPHHADCWAYLGRCAIFGCRGAVAISANRRWRLVKLDP